MIQQAIYQDLSGASVFLTGGGSGIGAALTLGLAAQGAQVTIADRLDASDFCNNVEAETGVRPNYVQCDITDSIALRRAVDSASEVQGPVRVLINNAANDERHGALAVTESDWDRLIAVNLKAYFFAAQAVIPGMMSAGGGSIINMTSISYMMGNVGYPVYVAANSGINGMTRSLAREFGPHKIRVNALAPGWVLTEKQRALWVTPDGLSAHLDRQCLKDSLSPDDILGGTLFLASQASRMMTGQSLVIDGGVVATG